MKARPFWENIIVAMAVLVAFNYLVTKRSDTDSLQFVRSIPKFNSPDILFLGDSTMAWNQFSGFQDTWREHTGESVSIKNGGITASTPAEQYLALRQMLKHHPDIRTVACGFWDFNLCLPQHMGWTNVGGAKSIGYTIEPGIAASLYWPDSKVGQLRFRLESMIPMLAQRHVLWAVVEKQRRVLSHMGLHYSDEQLQAERFILPYKDAASFEALCQKFGRAELWVPIQRMIEDCNQLGIELVFVEMPVPPDHQKRYASSAWHAYRAHVRKLVEEQGAHYIEASGWLEDPEDFGDIIHVSRQGSAIFTPRLATEMAMRLRWHPAVTEVPE